MKAWLYFRTALFLVFAALPASNNFKLNNYGFGSGGTAKSNSTNFGVNGITGEQSSLQVNGTTYNAQPGNNYTQNADVPTITITNPASYYNKLLITIGPGPNPTDTIFAVAISTDNFATTKFVKSDGTITTTLTYPTDYRTYAGWGSGAGALVTGLLPSTTYYVKAKAMQGNFTESAYGPVSSVATVDPSITFSLSLQTLDLGTLTAGTVISAPSNIVASFATNGEQGGNVFIYGKNVGLRSPTAAYTIASSTADLAPATEGFGAQAVSASQTTGGPLTIVSPYNVSGTNVAVTDTTVRPIFATVGPITGGSGSILIKAKSGSLTPAATDYSEILTIIASAAF